MPSSLLFSAPSCTADLLTTTRAQQDHRCGYRLPSRGAFDPHRRLAAGMPEHVWVDLEANLGFVTGTREEFGEAPRVNGPPRSEAKTKGEADWRLSSRSARNSSPRRGCVAALPPLAGARALCPSRMRSTTALMASCILSL